MFLSLLDYTFLTKQKLFASPFTSFRASAQSDTFKQIARSISERAVNLKPANFSTFQHEFCRASSDLHGKIRAAIPRVDLTHRSEIQALNGCFDGGDIL